MNVPSLWTEQIRSILVTYPDTRPFFRDVYVADQLPGPIKTPTLESRGQHGPNPKTRSALVAIWSRQSLHAQRVWQLRTGLASSLRQPVVSELGPRLSYPTSKSLPPSKCHHQCLWTLLYLRGRSTCSFGSTRALGICQNLPHIVFVVMILSLLIAFPQIYIFRIFYP